MSISGVGGSPYPSYQPENNLPPLTPQQQRYIQDIARFYAEAASYGNQETNDPSSFLQPLQLLASQLPPAYGPIIENIETEVQGSFMQVSEGIYMSNPYALENVSQKLNGLIP